MITLIIRINTAHLAVVCNSRCSTWRAVSPWVSGRPYYNVHAYLPAKPECGDLSHNLAQILQVSLGTDPAAALAALYDLYGEDLA